jgi:Rap1a immunity proteins
MKRIVLGSVAAMLMLGAGPAQAKSGNDLYGWCTSPDLKPLCDVYVQGVYDGLISMQGAVLFTVAAMKVPAAPEKRDPNVRRTLGLWRFCPPEGVTYNQVVDITVAYIRDHPAERHYDAAFEIRLAMIAAFPCQN